MRANQRLGLIIMVFSIVAAIIFFFAAETGCAYNCDRDFIIYTLRKGGYFLDEHYVPAIRLTWALAACLIAFATGLLCATGAIRLKQEA